MEKESELKPVYLKTSDIQFSQSRVSDTFRNRTKLNDLISKLVEKKICLGDIECIRVVKYQGSWVTLDNRRLRVFKNALIMQIPVLICDLKIHLFIKNFTPNAQIKPF